MSVYQFNQFPSVSYQKAIKDSIIQPIFRLYVLYPDENIREDITDYLILGSGSLSINYQSGVRRSLNFNLNNSDGKFTPYSAESLIWINTKFKLELGIKIGDDEIYNSAGIFVISNPDTTHVGSQNIIQIQCSDKFALLNGDLGGVLDSIYLVEAETNIKNAIEELLLLDNGNGFPIDSKPLVFDSIYRNEVTQCDIQKSPNDAIGDIIVDLSDMLGCDVWYDVEGNLTIRNGITDISYLSKPTLWNYRDTELEYLEGNITYNFQKVKNRVVVAGCNTNNEYVYSGISENTNPQSPTRISIIGTKNLYIEDENIYSDELAQQRADYELNKISILQNTISISSTYMIHLDVNECISLTDSFYNYFENRFVIQSITVPIGIDSKISIECSNVGTLPFYPSAE